MQLSPVLSVVVDLVRQNSAVDDKLRNVTTS